MIDQSKHDSDPGSVDGDAVNSVKEGDEEGDACGPPGPTREAGGTTGAKNLSPGAANRTGGATSGVSPGAPRPPQTKQIPPDPN